MSEIFTVEVVSEPGPAVVEVLVPSGPRFAEVEVPGVAGPPGPGGPPGPQGPPGPISDGSTIDLADLTLIFDNMLI